MSMLDDQQVLGLVERHFVGPFVWGRSDCAQAACAAFRELWGVDPLASIRRYDSEFGALRQISENGGEAFVDVVFARAGLVRCAARPGAIGVLPSADARIKWAMALCLTPLTCVTKCRAGGLSLRPARDAMFWSVSWAL